MYTVTAILQFSGVYKFLTAAILVLAPQYFNPLYSPSLFNILLAFIFPVLTASQELQGFSFCTQITPLCLEIL